MTIFCIAGPRDFTDRDTIYTRLDEFFKDNLPEHIITGDAKGVDSLAQEWGKLRGISSIEKYIAYWDKYGKSAGPIRNHEMALVADELISFRINKLWSRGTLNMTNQMKNENKPVHIIDVTRVNKRSDDVSY